MADHDDRDRALERLLPQVLGGAASTPCVDGETLAAWSEGGLRSTDAARVEAHVADCARCQAMVGAFVRITPAAVAAKSPWQRWRLGWLLPLATAAAAVALWAVIPGTTVRQESQVTLADARRDTPAPAASSAPSPPPAAEREAAALAPPPQFADQLQRRQATSDAAAAEDKLAKKKERDENAAAVEAPRPLNEAVAITGAAPAVDTAQTLASVRARNDAPSEPTPAQPLIEQRKAVEERVAVAPQAAPVPAAPARSTPPPPPASPAPTTGGRGAIADRAAASGRAAEFGVTQSASAIEIPTPVASTRWRLAVSGVERTTNNGTTWVAVPGVDFMPVRAGSAPAVNVCWIVGSNGRVYLTTDGLRFTRLGFPEAVDLVAVRATDARTATVTTADGRTFRTTDGGANWTQ